MTTHQNLCSRDQAKPGQEPWIQTGLRVVLLLLMTLFSLAPVVAQQTTRTESELAQLQRIYVPESDLGAIIPADRYGAILSTVEFEKLLEAARNEDQAVSSRPPNTLLHAATYEVSIDENRLVGTLTIQLSTFNNSWSEARFDVTGWNIEEARLGDAPAMIARDGEQLNVLRLFIRQPGKHVLKLGISTPLQAQGSDKAANVRLAKIPGHFRITLPAGKFLKVVQAAVERPAPVDQQATYAIPIGGRSDWNLMITDRKQATRADVLTFASTAMGVKVQPTEMTWIARTELQVFGQEIDRLRCLIPAALEITSVESSGLESWELADAMDDATQTELTLRYRQGFDGRRTITFRGILSASPNESWAVPTLNVVNVTSHTGTLIVQHADALRLQTVEAKGIRAAETVQAVPHPEGSAEVAETQLGFEIWDENFQLEFVTGLKQQEVTAAMTNVLDISQNSLQLLTAVSVETRLAPLFDLQMRLPAEWEVGTIQVDGQDRDWKLVSSAAGINEVRIPLNPPLVPGQVRNVTMISRLIPESWPVKKTASRIPLPEVRLPQASMVEALYGISAEHDLELVVQEMQGLDPAGQEEIAILNEKLKPLGKSVRLAMTYQDTVFSGQLDVSRKPAVLTAETVTFFRVDPDSQFTRLEALLDLSGGGYQELTLLVSEFAGENLRFQLVPENVPSNARAGRIVEQIPGSVADGFRSWTLRFDQFLQGRYRLISEVRIPRPEEGSALSPTQLKFPESQLVSGYVAIEGPTDEHIQVLAVDVDGRPLQTIDPVDFPATRYQPVVRVVAGYRYVHTGWQVSVSTTEFERAAVPTVIGHTAEMTSVVSKAGEFQHQANLQLTVIGAQALLVELPDGAELWSTLIDDTPVEIRKSAEGIQIPVAGLDSEKHQLQLIYSTPAPEMEGMGRLQTVPPTLRVIDGQGTTQPVEILTQSWQLHVPDETLLVDSDGLFNPVDRLFAETFFTELREQVRLPRQGKAILRLLATVFVLAGLFIFWWLLGWRTRKKLALGGAVVILLCAGGALILGQMLLLSAGARIANEMEPTYETGGMQGMGSMGGVGAMEQADLEAEISEEAAMTTTPVPEAPAFDAGSPFDANRQLPASEMKPTAEPQAELSRPGRGRALTEADPFALSPAAPAAQAGGFGGGISPQEKESLPAVSNNVGGLAVPQLAQQQAIDGLAIAEKQLLTDQRERTLNRGRPFSGGLLSMTFAIQIPEGMHSQDFYYQGNGVESGLVDLNVRYASRSASWMLVWSMAIGISLLGWWQRSAGVARKAIWLILTLLFPIAFAWVVPLLWQLLLEGVLLGGLGSLILWAILWSTQCCKCCCLWFHRKICSAAGLGFWGASVMILLCSSAHAEESSEVKPFAPPPKPYVVVPYRSLAEIEAADRVWVPDALYRKLWNAAHPDDVPIENGPVAASVAEATYVGELVQVGEEQQVQLKARWVVSVMTAETVTLQLPVVDMAVSTVLLNGAPAAVVKNPNGHLQLVLQGQGTQIIDAVLSLPAEVNGVSGEFALNLLPSSAGLFIFNLPDSKSDLRVRVNGQEKLYRRRVVDGQTRIEVPVDRGGERTIVWFPKTELGADDRIVQVETAIAAGIDDSGLSIHQAFQVRVRQGGLNDVLFDLPTGLSVREISGGDVGGWEILKTDAGQQLKVFFRREISDQTDLFVNLFGNVNIGRESAQLSIPTIAPLDVSRETVQFGLYGADYLKLRVVSTEGLSQVELARYQPVVAPRHAFKNLLNAYRSSSRPFLLRVAVERREAELKTEVEHGIHIARRKQLIATRIVWRLTGTPQRRVDVAVPEGYLPISVVCAEAADWYVRPGDSGDVLSIEFPSPRLGRIEVGLEGHLPRQPDVTDVELQLPRPIGAIAQTATLGIWLDPAYQASVAQTGGWKLIRPNQLSGNYRKLEPRPVQFAFQSSTIDPANVQLTVESAVPKFTADGVTLIAVSDATIDYGVTLRWGISQAATDEFIFTAPAWLENVEIRGPQIRQIQSEDIENNRKRWRVSLIDPVREQYLLTIAATVPAPVDLVVQTPRVQMETSSMGGAYESIPVQQQYAVLVNLSPNQLVPVDRQEFDSISVDKLPLVVNEELVQQAMEVTRVNGTHQPSWEIQRMEELAVAKAVVVAAHLETALELDGSWRTLATYGIRNRGRQFLGLQLPENSRILSVFVRGEPSRTVTTQQAGKTIHLVALPQTSVADLSFDVTVLLAGRFDRKLTAELAWRGKKFSLPAPTVLSPNVSAEFGMPVTQTLWNVHVPDGVHATVVNGVQSTNLTPHEDNAWLAVEEQSLERFRADIVEMARIVSDKSVSQSRRMQAKQNLKRLNQQLQESDDFYESDQFYSIKESELRALAEAKEQLQTEADKALELTDEYTNGIQALPYSQNSGREYIDNLNTFIIENNTASGVGKQDQKSPLGRSYNFIAADQAEAAKSAAKKSNAEVASRKRLRSQLAEQTIVQNDSQVEEKNQRGGEQQPGASNLNLDAVQRQSTFEFTTDFSGMAADRVQPSPMAQGLGLQGADGGSPTAAGQAMAPTWGTSGGLSIEMQLPKHATTLSFSKVGGDPLLTLSLRDVETDRRLRGFVWCVASLVVGFWVVRQLRSADTSGQYVTVVANLALLLGLAGFFFLSSGIGWICFWIFVFGGVTRVLAARFDFPSLRLGGY